jgi:hypothetical protein
MDFPSRQEMRGIRRSGRVLILSVGGVVIGALAFVMGLVQFLQVNHFIQNSLAVNGVISDKFITYHESNGDTFPDFHLQYTYAANGTSMTQSQQVGRDVYDGSAEGQTIVVYYDRNQPSSTRIDAAGSLGAPRAMIFIGAGALALGGLGLFLLYRRF